MTDDYGEYRVHPVAEMFPLMEGAEFVDLVESVDRDGLQDAIVLTADGKTIVDGRNRYRACQKVGRPPDFRNLGDHYTEEDLARFIVNANVNRRHLDVGQRAFIAVELEKIYAAEAKQRQREHSGTAPGRGKSLVPDQAQVIEPKARDRAAKEVRVGHGSVQKAKVLDGDAPDLAEEVRQGKKSLDGAYGEHQKREKQRAANFPVEKPAQTAPSRKMLTLVTHTGEEVPYPEPKAKASFNTTNDQISWAAWSWNPVTGCNHGCDYCYAREMANRESYRDYYPVGFTPLFHHERLDAPANSKVPVDAEGTPAGRVFVCSMADLYGKWVPQAWIKAVHASCIANPQWEYLFLTKFPDRYLKVPLPESGWMGTSVDTQRRVAIAESVFRRVENVRVKWLSIEPLLEPLQFNDLSMFDWVVIGAQSATLQSTGVVPAFAPPFEWVVDLVAQARAAGCGIYMKPNLLGIPSHASPGMQLIQEGPRGYD